MCRCPGALVRVPVFKSRSFIISPAVDCGRKTNDATVYEIRYLAPQPGRISNFSSERKQNGLQRCIQFVAFPYLNRVPIVTYELSNRFFECDFSGCAERRSFWNARHTPKTSSHGTNPLQERALYNAGKYYECYLLGARSVERLYAREVFDGTLFNLFE